MLEISFFDLKCVPIFFFTKVCDDVFEFSWTVELWPADTSPHFSWAHSAVIPVTQLVVDALLFSVWGCGGDSGWEEWIEKEKSYSPKTENVKGGAYTFHTQKKIKRLFDFTPYRRRRQKISKQVDDWCYRHFLSFFFFFFEKSATNESITAPCAPALSLID